MLLKRLTTLSSPRMGVDRFINTTLEQLRAFYDADICLLPIANPDRVEYRLYRVERDNPNATTDEEPVPGELMHMLLTLPTDHAALYSDSPLGWREIGSTYYAYDVVRREPAEKEWNASKMLATILDAKSFVAVPIRRNNRTVGRLFLTSKRQSYFDASDLDFLLQVAEHILPIIDSIWLVDQLASEAAEEERQKIARDIHDSIIQPYIGLRLGLVGIRRKLALEEGDENSSVERLNDVINKAAFDTDHLIAITDGGIGDLRQYVRGLKESGEGEGNLSAAVRRFAVKFTRATGIDVEVNAEADINVEDHLATEAFQMLVEGLSNIRRHTQSVRATISLEHKGNRLALRIENDGTDKSAPSAFTPRSIKERAQALGGRTNVEIRGDGTTVVIVEIPL